MGTPHGADTTETVLHVDAATRLPDARMPSQEGHHAGGLEQCDSPQDQAEREHQPTVVMVSHQPLRAKADASEARPSLRDVLRVAHQFNKLGEEHER